MLGALAIVGAGFNGVSFLDYGHAFSSMIMAGLWALALACYLAGAILAARQFGGRSLSASMAAPDSAWAARESWSIWPIYVG